MFNVKVNIEDEYAGPYQEMSLWFNEDRPLKGGDRLVLGAYSDLVKHLLRPIDVRLNTEVVKVDYSDANVVTVSTSGQQSYTARKAVIVTVPLGVLKASSITFVPPLPRRNQQAIKDLGMGILNKCVMVFEKSFWGSKEEWIERISQDGFQATLSMMPVANQPILYGFNSAGSAERIESWSDTKTCEEMLANLRTIWPNAPGYNACVVTRWGQDPYSRGSYSYTTDRMEYEPAHTRVGAPVAGGRVSFAGEATSLSNPATVHGAYSSGVQVAQRLA